ncbi:MAG TPA: hypothetical protein VLH40_05430 [Atribacteraceae bacterium]|nr:hypothetical protein [Atribacteraceae bacterium]
MSKPNIPSYEGRLRIRLTVKAQQWVDTIAIVIALVGIVLMGQTYTVTLFTAGFWMMALGGFFYIWTTFLPKRDHSIVLSLRVLGALFGVLMAVIFLSQYLAPIFLGVPPADPAAPTGPPRIPGIDF